MDQPAVRYEDVTGLKSRVSWGAVFGGAAVALAVYLLFTLFFAGLGLSLSEAGVRDGTIGIGAIVAAVITLLAALFVGGCVTTRLTAGETSGEATIHGILCWAVVTAFSLGTAAMGARAGYSAMLGATYASQAVEMSWEESARRAGVPQERIDQMRRTATPENAAATAQDPAVRERVRQNAMWATWGGFVATLLAIGASVAGARFGAGPNFRLLGIGAVRVQGDRGGRPGLAGV